ncbi:MAG: hypothetical protein ACI4QR_04390, partial [Eubacteriales bacterium]
MEISKFRKEALVERSKKLVSKLPFILSLLFSLAALFAVLYYTIWPAEGYFHSDCTDSLYWAQASVDSGSVFNPDFYYAALLPFSASIWLVPLIKIFGVTMTAHVIGMVIFAILFYASVIFVCRSMEWSWNYTLLSSGFMMLLLSLSDKLREIMWGHVIYYSLGLLILFVMLGLLFRASKNFEKGNRKKAYIYAALLFVLAICGATNGFQCIALYTLPIAAAIVAEAVFNSKEKLLSETNYTYSAALAILIGGTAVGLLVLKFMKGDIVAGYADAYSLLDSVSKWTNQLLKFPESYFSLMGISIEDGAGVSISTVFNLIKLAVSLLILVLPLILLFRYKKIEDKRTKILLWVHIVTSAIIMFGFICGRLSAGNWRLIPMVGTGILTSVAAINEMFAAKEYSLSWRRVAALLAVFPILCSLGSFRTISKMPADYGRDNALHTLSDFLIENGLEYGYATFWNAQATTVISDSAVKVRTVNADTKNGVYKNLYQTNGKWYEDQEGISEYFVALSNYEAYIVSYNSTWVSLKENHLVKTLECGDFQIFVFDCNIFTVEVS